MKYPKRRGSALLLALIIIALVGTVGFGLIRIALLQGQVANSASASIAAFNAAETGLEYALLQYRLDKDVEIAAGSAESALTLNPNQSFDVTMTHNAKIFGTAACLAKDAVNYFTFMSCNTDPLNPMNYMEPDSSMEFQTTTAADSVVVRAIKNDYTGAIITGQTRADKGILQVRFYLRSSDGTEVLKKEQTYMLGQAEGRSLAAKDGMSINGPFTFNKVTLSYLHDSDVKLAVMLKIKSGATDLMFDTGITTISAVGKSGAVKRRMAARIDRRSDRVLGIFDYALHTGAVNTP